MEESKRGSKRLRWKLEIDRGAPIPSLSVLVTDRRLGQAGEGRTCKGTQAREAVRFSAPFLPFRTTAPKSSVSQRWLDGV